jgi:hypothetical protein
MITGTRIYNFLWRAMVRPHAFINGTEFELIVTVIDYKLIRLLKNMAAKN